MTEQFKTLINESNNFLKSPTYAAKDFFEYIDQYWFDHELDFEYDEDNIGTSKKSSEHTIVSDILELVDRYDSCDEIVKHDQYCINTKQLREMLKDLLEKYGLLSV